MLKTIPRDVSWLSFNARVLQEAADPEVPLRERVKFLGIFSNNRDEFFRRWVASLQDASHRNQAEYAPLKRSAKILKEIKELIFRQQEDFEKSLEFGFG